MPYSLVLNLLPKSPIPPGFLTGRHLHALFLNLVSSVDRTLGDSLHANQSNKPFTLSPLQIEKRSPSGLHYQHQKSIPAGTPCWWRISLIDDRLFSNLYQLWLHLNPQQPWHLGPADLAIVNVLGTPQSTQHWANFCSYEQLYESASQSDRKLAFDFYTPTAFRQGNYDSVLPTPEQIFSSLLRRWNSYSPIPLEVTTESLYPSFFNIRTEVVTDPRLQFKDAKLAGDPRNRFMGFVGKIAFKILGDVDSQSIKQLNTLADYAIYAGVGRKTTMGMGMARRIRNSSF